MGILWAILLFSFLILVHELGHFVAAKAFGVQVNEFALFMGPAIFKKQIGETEYSLRCIPFGGYCAMEGEDGDSDNPRAFTSVAWWKRLIILVAGVTMNGIFGLAMACMVLLPQQAQILPEIDYIEPWSTMAGENGMQSGDRILAIDGETIYVQSDITMLLQLNPGDTHDVLVLRRGEKMLLDDLKMVRQPVQNEDGTTSMLYGMNFKVAPMDTGDKLKNAFLTCVDDVRSVRLSLQMLLGGSAGLKDVSGPVGIVNIVSDTTQQTETPLETFLTLMRIGAMLSINLAVMNLLPIPALDGGRAVCLLLTVAVESITRRKIDPKYEGYLHMAGMAVLLGFMAIVTFKDIFTIFKG